MAYNENTANRIREFLFERELDFREKIMFGGLCFMLADKILCGTRIHKQTKEDLLLCRVGEEVYENLIENNDVLPMGSNGRTMKGFVFIAENGHVKQKDLIYWLQLCLNHNPFAKSSIAKKKK